MRCSLLLALAAACAATPGTRLPGEPVSDSDRRGDLAGEPGADDGAGDPRADGDDGAGDRVGADGDAAASESVILSLDVGGLGREAEVYVPASRVVPAPLVVDWHCYGCTREHQANASGFRQLADEHGFLVAYPAGLSNSFNAGGCCGWAADQGIDDVGLARALVAEVSARWSVDAKRVYSSGLSNGGAMSHRLACEAADLFAAVAPVAYPLPLEPLSACQPSRPISVFHFHGVADTVVPLDGSGTFTATTVAESFAYWGTANQCDGAPQTVWQRDGSICEQYPGCSGGAQDVLCTIAGGHILYTNDDDIDIAAEAWAFLSQHQLP